MVLACVFIKNANWTYNPLLKTPTLVLTTENDDYISTPSLGDATIFLVAQESIYSLQSSHTKPKIKLRFKSYLCLFLPSVILLRPSTDAEEANELNGEKKKKQWGQISKPKYPQPTKLKTK